MRRTYITKKLRLRRGQTSLSTLQSRAKSLTKNATHAEVILSHALQKSDIKFHFQYIIAPFIIDFLIPSHRLCIELDGSHHKMKRKYDRDRTAYLHTKGYTVIRFWNSEVISDVLGVLNVIKGYLNDRRIQSRTTSRKAG